MRLAGRVAVITGSAVGLGRAVATRFAREGARVALADTNDIGGNTVQRQIQREGGAAIFVPTDIRKEADVAALLQSATSAFGRIDILYNNAAVLFADRDARAHELSVEVWDQIMQVNLRGPFLCAKYSLPFMLEQGGGSIINVGSPTGLYGCAPSLTAYSSSKGGVVGLTRAMAAAYARDKIRVNSIIPGTMDTPMNEYILTDGQSRERYREAIPLGRLGLPADVEGLAVFLASDESCYCTGGIYACDGGLTAV